MTPLVFLILTLSMTLAVAAPVWWTTRQRRRQLRALAARWKMHYSPGDRFRLAARIAGRLPAVGAAAVKVRDLIYGIEDQDYRYLFSAEFTIGTVRSQRRMRSICTFAEPRDRQSEPADFPMLVAPDTMSLIEQYEFLRQELATATK
jgi:hypothetical protein